jgi:hypothetical protein
MDDETSPTSEMLGRIAAQLMVLYDDAMTRGRSDAAEAYAMALNVVRAESRDVQIRFGGPPPTLRTVPRKSFPEELEGRLSPMHRPRNGQE